ncbi:hypothetical protein WJH60_02565 [Burkholderia orbicola]|uniref:hypothetical protein n=1 Tax=Burkholderia orbicola TaxID=2978683 RepID=UPI0035C70A69
MFRPFKKGEGQAIWNGGREPAGKVGPTRDSAAADEDETRAIIACRFGQAVRDIDSGRRFGISLARARPRRAINCPHAGYFFNPENEKRLEPRRHYC